MYSSSLSAWFDMLCGQSDIRSNLQVLSLRVRIAGVKEAKPWIGRQSHIMVCRPDVKYASMLPIDYIELKLATKFYTFFPSKHDNAPFPNPDMDESYNRWTKTPVRKLGRP